MSLVGIKPGGYESKHSYGSSSSYEYQAFPAGGPESDRTASPSVITGFSCTLPFRFSGLDIKRKLIRMMLQLEKAQFQLEQRPGVGTSLYFITDYTHSLMNTAISRGELRYSSPDEMVSYYLSLTGELKQLFATAPHPKVCLRNEVRQRVEIFLEKYATENWV